MLHIKLLFICSRNRWRSPTAEKIFEEANARIKVTGGHIGWANIIFVMEKKHLRRIRKKYGDQLYDKKGICLDIPDDYGFMNEELIKLLKARVSEYMVNMIE